MILVITKRHIDRKRKKHPTVLLQGRKQTVTIKHKHHKDSPLNWPHTGTKNSVASFCYSTDVRNGLWGILIKYMIAYMIKWLNYIPVFCWRKQQRVSSRQICLGPRASVFDTAHQKPQQLLQKKKSIEYLLCARHCASHIPFIRLERNSVFKASGYYPSRKYLWNEWRSRRMSPRGEFTKCWKHKKDSGYTCV